MRLLVDSLASPAWGDTTDDPAAAYGGKEKEGGKHVLTLSDGTKTLADCNIESGMTLWLDVACVKVVTCDAAGEVCDVGDVVVFAGAAGGDVPAPLETQVGCVTCDL